MLFHKTKSFTLVLSLVFATLSVAPWSQAQDQQLDQELIKKSSLIIGFNTAKQLVAADVDMDKAALIEGFTKGLQSAKLDFSDEEVEAIMTAFQKFAEQNYLTRIKKRADSNRAEGEAYLAKNAEKPGVKKLDNGVQYEVLKEGNGQKPAETNIVSIHYHGTLPDGTVFDSSVQRKTPAEFPVNRVVKGFSAALQAMSVGDKWRVVIPSDLAYGAQGPESIGPNRTLIFEIELLGIVE